MARNNNKMVLRFLHKALIGECLLSNQLNLRSNSAAASPESAQWLKKLANMSPKQAV